MARYRVLGLALLVTVLLAVVALAAHGRPLSRGGGGAGKGPPAVFYDYAWTTIVIFFLLLLALGIAGLWILRGERGKPRPYWFTLRALAAYCLLALLFAYLAKHHLRFRHLPGSGENGLPGPGQAWHCHDEVHVQTAQHKDSGQRFDRRQGLCLSVGLAVGRGRDRAPHGTGDDNDGQ